MEFLFKVEDVPCHECICVPVCRLKSFNKLLNECDKIKGFYYIEQDVLKQHKFDNKIIAMQDSLKDPVWKKLLQQINQEIKNWEDN
jgi:hypothetical protein